MSAANVFASARSLLLTVSAKEIECARGKMLHSDQSDSARRAAHSAQGGRCPECHEEYGWWQGIVTDLKPGAEWLCAGCAAIFSEVPPPAGFVAIDVHPQFWRDHGIPTDQDVTTCLRQTSAAIPFVIAWAFETRWHSTRVFQERLALIPRHMERSWLEKGYVAEPLVPVVLQQPLWWTRSDHPKPWAYIGSDADRLFESIMRIALKLENMEEWKRSSYPDDSVEWSNFEEFHGTWFSKSPANSHGVNREQGWYRLLPWHAIWEGARHGQKKVNGQLFDKKQIQSVEEGVIAAFRSLCVVGAASPPRLWDAIGFRDSVQEL